MNPHFHSMVDLSSSLRKRLPEGIIFHHLSTSFNIQIGLQIHPLKPETGDASLRRHGMEPFDGGALHHPLTPS